MDNIVKQKYYTNLNNNVDNNNFGESRTINNLLNLIDYKNYKNIFIDIINKNNEDNNILELGCGLGIAITELCYFCNDNNYYGINMARSGKFATGYEAPKYNNKYIVDFMKNYGYDMTNKKNIKHYDHDMFKLDIFKDDFFDLIYSQSTIGKVLPAEINKQEILVEELLKKIVNKLKINGCFINHLDSTDKKINYENKEIFSGYKILNDQAFFYEIYFSDNKYCQDSNNEYTEICLFLKKIDKKEYKNFKNVSKNINICNGKCIHTFFKILYQ